MSRRPELHRSRRMNLHGCEFMHTASLNLPEENGGWYRDRTYGPCRVNRADGFAVVSVQQLTLLGSVPKRPQTPDCALGGPTDGPTRIYITPPNTKTRLCGARMK